MRTGLHVFTETSLGRHSSYCNVGLADRLGGKPEDHRRLTLAIAALSHGTATQLLISGVQESVVRELRADLRDGGGEFGGVCAEERAAEQGMTYRSEWSHSLHRLGVSSHR